jgi:hypothetical protein
MDDDGKKPEEIDSGGDDTDDDIFLHEEYNHSGMIIQKTLQRVTRVEETVRFISIEQNRIWSMMEKITNALDTVSARMQNNELADVAIRERTEHHAKTIESLQSEQVDVSKLLAQHDHEIDRLKNVWISFVNFSKWFGATAGTLVIGSGIGWLISHFVK